MHKAAVPKTACARRSGGGTGPTIGPSSNAPVRQSEFVASAAAAERVTRMLTGGHDLSPHAFETALSLSGADGQYQLELDRTWEGQPGNVWGGFLLAVVLRAAGLTATRDQTGVRSISVPTAGRRSRTSRSPALGRRGREFSVGVEDRDAGGLVLGHEPFVLGLTLALSADPGGGVLQVVRWPELTPWTRGDPRYFTTWACGLRHQKTLTRSSPGFGAYLCRR